MANKLKCKHCKKKEDLTNMTQAGLGYVCKSCIVEYSVNQDLKRHKKNVADDKKIKIVKEQVRKAEIYKLEKISSIESKVQVVFNRMRRFEELLEFKRLGVEPYCISCGKTIGNDTWACGHNKAAGNGQFHIIRFDRKNTFLQHNKRCNKELSGDNVNYQIGLINRFGQKEGQAIIDYCNTYKPDINWTREHLAEMKKDFAKRARELEKELSQ